MCKSRLETFLFDDADSEHWLQLGPAPRCAVIGLDVWGTELLAPLNALFLYEFMFVHITNVASSLESFCFLASKVCMQLFLIPGPNILN